MQKKQHLSIAITPCSQLDKSPSNKQFAVFDIQFHICKENQSHIHKDCDPAAKIGAVHTPTGEDTMSAAIAIGERCIHNQDILDELMQVIVDYIEQIEL